ncbi:hypothetical protein VrSk94_11930 [Vibrio rotiferianus]
MKGSKRLVLELLLVAIICVLAVFWIFEPDGNFEPIIVLIGALVSLIALITSLYVKKKKQDFVIEEQLKPSQLHFINQLIELKSSVYASARKQWDTGITSEMRGGNSEVMSFYEDTWLQLAANFPIEHFGNTTHVEYLDKYVSERYEAHYQAANQNGYGEGSMAFVIVTADVMKDLDSQIVELVSIVSSSTDSFDYGKWVQRWASVA